MDSNPASTWPLLGCGVGLRPDHYDQLLGAKPGVDWFEATSENYMTSGGRPLWVLEQIRRNVPVALHGVSMSIGSTDPIDQDYLERLKVLADRIDPAFVSDHLCWASVERKNLHDLLPLPFTEEALGHICTRVDQVQNFLGRRILLENVSSYITYQHSVMSEWEFLAEVSRRSGCGILLDINNIYVNAVNHGFDAQDFLKGIPGSAVGYFHLAGHTNMGKWLFDTHSRPVIEPVWDLYRDALRLYGKKSTLIEWDEDIPDWDRLAEEADQARKIYQAASNKGVIGGDRALESQASKRRGITSAAAAPHNDGAATLAEVQAWMRRRIYPDLTEASDASASAAGSRPVELNPQGGDPGEARLEVYAGGYPARIAESLKESFEAVQHILGEGMFLKTAYAYAQTRPSKSFDLGLAGRDFPDFLKHARVTEKLPFLPDLAALEWKISEAFHAYDQPAMNPAALMSVAPEDWEGLVFDFRPSAALIKAAWPVVDLWRARRVPIEEFDIEVTNRPQKAIVIRSGFKVICEPLESEEFEVLSGLAAGRTLGEVCETLAERLPEDGEIPLDVWFGRWTGLGLFTSVHPKEHHGAFDPNSLLR